MICFELKDIENIVNSNPQYNIKLTNCSTFNDTPKHLFKSSNLGDTVENIMNSTNSELNNEKFDLCVSKLSLYTRFYCSTETIRKERKHNSNYKSASWWSKELKFLRKKTRKLKLVFQQNRTEINWTNYKTSRHEYNKQIRKEKLTDFKQTCTSAINPWEIVRKILKSKPYFASVPTLRKIKLSIHLIIKKLHPFFCKSGSLMIIKKMTHQTKLISD